MENEKKTQLVIGRESELIEEIEAILNTTDSDHIVIMNPSSADLGKVICEIKARNPKLDKILVIQNKEDKIIIDKPVEFIIKCPPVMERPYIADDILYSSRDREQFKREQRNRQMNHSRGLFRKRR